MWKGTISFGLVSVPVRLVAATETKDVSFRQVHREDGGRIRFKRVCEADGQEVPYSDIAKGYELPGNGGMLVLSDEDLAELPLASVKSIEVDSFVPASQLAQMITSKVYYVAPDEAGLRAYGLLAEALASSELTALVRVTLRQRESLGRLSTREDGVMVLETMLWPDEVRQPGAGFLGEVPASKPAELKAAMGLIKAMTTDFDPATCHDGYREALQELVEAKIADRAVTAPAAKDAGGVSLVDTLTASIAARAESKPARKPAARKAPARKRAA
jgi:DNA end-binding protein Ku